MTVTHIRGLLATIAVAGMLATSALAAGEPKNGFPFTRVDGTPSHTVLTASVHRTSANLMQAGEPKNEFPFTRR